MKVAVSLGLAGIRRGPVAVAKSVYSVLKACAWVADRGPFDHILAYWGSYATTCAIAFHQLTDPTAPVTMFLHRADLYQQPNSMRLKLLYVDNVIVVCDFNRRYIQDNYGDIYDRVLPKIHCHHPSLDVSGMPFLESGRPPASLLAVGRLHQGKGFDDLLRAIALLRNRSWNVQAELVGDGPERNALARLARRLRIETAVRFRGWLPFDEVQRAMMKATVLVHPSAPFGDAVPTVIKEAMALGTPVVASSVAGIPELLDGGRCGVLVPPRRPESLADAIAILLGDLPRLRRLAYDARGFAEANFDLWRNGRRLADILRSTPPRTPVAQEHES